MRTIGKDFNYVEEKVVIDKKSAKKIADLTAKVEELTAKNDELVTANEDLTAKVEELTEIKNKKEK